MNRKSILSLTITAFSLVLCMPVRAQDPMNPMSGGQDAVSPPLRGEHEAMRMVPARAALKFTLSADKLADGAAFEARLANRTQLINGPLLPAGTRLVGTVVRDDTNNNGASTLALRFDTAYLKDGMTVPIKATIVGAYGPEEINGSGWTVTPGDQVPNTWNDGTLRIDNIGVLHGVDLHSAIASPNSGVFVSETGRTVKIVAGSEFALAIAARHDADQVSGL
jgi:hypothetical protein